MPPWSVDGLICLPYGNLALAGADRRAILLRPIVYPGRNPDTIAIRLDQAATLPAFPAAPVAEKPHKFRRFAWIRNEPSGIFLAVPEGPPSRGMKMNRSGRAAVVAAGLAVASIAALPLFALGALAADQSLSLESFSTARALSAYELSAPGIADGSLQNSLAGPLTVNGLPIGAGSPAYATSTLLSSNLALDSGRGLDVAQRFLGYDGVAQPFLSAVSASYLSLANGGRYSGFTFVPADDFRLRAGVSLNSERLDRFSFDSAPPGPLALTYDASQSKSLLG